LAEAKATKRRPCTQGRGGAGIENGAASLRQHAAHRLAPDQETAQRVLPPHGFELRLADLKRRDHGVVADIVGDKVQRFLLADFVQQGDHVRFTRYVGDDRFDAAAGVPDFAGDGRNARRGASGDDDPQALFGKPARERGTEPGRRSYAHHNGRLYAHDNANLMTDTRVIAGTPWGPAMWSRQGEEASKNESHAHQHKKRRAAPFREQPFHCRTAVALDRFKRR